MLRAIAGILLASALGCIAQAPEVWLTDPAGGVLFTKTTPAPPTVHDEPIQVGEEQFQTVEGFGFAMTGGSAMMIDTLPAARRDALLQELFARNGSSIGISYLRISLGASDLDPAPFSYDDMPDGSSDPELKAFSLGPDYKHLIPILKRVLMVNPAMQFLASPWSPPLWMKARPLWMGSSLPESNMGVYARYLVRYIQAMKAEGIPITALTLQNEPLNPDNEPSMVMAPARQRDLIRDHLGPALAAAGLKTKILIYDHNCDEPSYQLSILADPEAAKYIEGSAFHLYAGSVSALTTVHDAHPGKGVYLTEQWTGAPGDMAGDFRWHMTHVVVGTLRNWGRAVLEWNLATDKNYGPHTSRGCDKCLGALTIEGGAVLSRNPSYYIIAHAAKFIVPGSVRVESTVPFGLANVAFVTRDRRTVVLVINDSPRTQGLQVQAKGYDAFAMDLASGAGVTLVFPPR